MTRLRLLLDCSRGLAAARVAALSLGDIPLAEDIRESGEYVAELISDETKPTHQEITS